MNSEYGDEFLYGSAATEEEEPLEKNSASDKLEEFKFQAEEKEKQRKDKRYFSAFRLIIGCLIFLSIIYVIETAVSAFLLKDVSHVTDGIIEIIKTLLFTLSGYLFARKENGD